MHFGKTVVTAVWFRHIHNEDHRWNGPDVGWPHCCDAAAVVQPIQGSLRGATVGVGEQAASHPTSAGRVDRVSKVSTNCLSDYISERPFAKQDLSLKIVTDIWNGNFQNKLPPKKLWGLKKIKIFRSPIIRFY